MFIDITQNVIPGIYDYYMISNCGRVFNKYLNIYLSPGVSGSGYLFVYLSTDHGQVMVQLHRLVMMSFYPIPNCNLFQVNHINGDKFDNRIFNLEWCTRSENQRHAFMTGLHKRPSNLNEDDIRHVCDLLAMDQYTNLQISLMVGNGLTETIVSDIKKKTCWKDISKDYTFYSRKGRKFSAEEIDESSFQPDEKMYFETTMSKSEYKFLFGQKPEYAQKIVCDRKNKQKPKKEYARREKKYKALD